MAASGVVGLQYTCLYYLFTHFIVVHGINLDARFSVIKRGPPDSYFGFSVAQHQVKNNNAAVIENVILVGAPKEIRQIQGKPSGGALYRCNAKLGSEICQRIEDGVSIAPTSDEVVEDQWLGVTVASQGPGQKAVACAHRFIKHNSALGICYLFVQDLQPSSDRLKLRPCEGKSHNYFMQDFGLCQAGMSAAIGQNDALVIGAPGSIIWQGVIFMTNVTDVLGASTTEMVSPYYDPNPQKREPNQQPTPTSAYTYNGYAVTMGRFDHSKTLYYVSGAPKSNNKGEIVFFKEMPPETLRYDKSQIIQGTLEFAGFGSSLLAVDLNNDGFDDLIVGAPYYYRKNRGGAFYVYLGGERMISENTKPTEILSRTMGDEECEQLKCEHARFGISLSKLGDINMDSYQDFAVGAPYEGNGAVYIYHGSNAEEGFNKNFAQRITASDLPTTGIMSFGYSLSGGMDLDENGYPDLLVGSYESSTVALLRSRPIIKLIPKLSVFPNAVNLETIPVCNDTHVKPEFKNRHCVTVTMCLSFTTKPPGSIRVIPEVVYSLEAEPKRRVARVDLQDAVGDENSLREKKLTLSGTGEVCASEIALLKSQFDDKLNPMEFRFHFGLSTDRTDPEPYPASAEQDVNLFPVLDTEGAEEGKSNAVTVEAEFVKECGDDNKCLSNLQFSVDLNGLKKSTDGVYEMVISQENYLIVAMHVSNEGEPAYLTRIYIQKPVSVTYLGTEPQDLVTCQGLENNLIVCDQIGNPFRPGKEVQFSVRLNVPNSMAETSDIHNVTVWVNTSSTEETPLNDRHELFLRVINKAEVTLTTNVVPDSAILCKGEPREVKDIVNEIDIGASVKHNFIVRNTGPGVVSESYLKISWPYAVVKDGVEKPLLYLMRKPNITGPNVKCNDADISQYINPDNIKEVQEADKAATGASKDAELTDDLIVPQDETQGSRRKRETEASTQRSPSTLVLSCRDGTAKCFTFSCKLGKLEPNANYAKITMDARLWESTLLTDYRKVTEVQIISWAEVAIPPKLKITQDTSDDSKRAITRALPDFKETAGQHVQWWIILVAVLVGLVVLLVVIFVLYKMGFFKRKRLEDMQMYKAEKKQQPMLQEDYDDEGA